MEQVNIYGIYRYKVTIEKDVEYHQWQEIASWCREHIQDIEYGAPSWRQCLSGSPPITDPDFSSWLFENEHEAVLFELTWG